jgi:TetR/AcrR family transcriptional regulator
MTAPRRRRNELPRSAARRTKAERHRQLLDHAKQLLSSLGYRATTLEQIAAAAGVTEAVLHRHFASKQALFLEILEEVRTATLHRWSIETASLTDPLAKLHTIIEMYLETTRQLALELRILHRALVESDEAETREPLRYFYLSCEELLAGVIAEGQQSGVFRRSLDPRVGAWELLRAALGYSLTQPLNIPLYAEPDYLPRAVECLLNCLLKTDV